MRRFPVKVILLFLELNDKRAALLAIVYIMKYVGES